ncbi:hypothetical protein ACODM8_10805 [Vibrio ostreicida]|uniref:Uncharacterized protein n=1 Tax=Vibrio ostreicida TaxID=526588 RepID=A0ABT8BNJ3_9VIBR|nr:hypothetical protein [Vibrio ostreicida]MDN3608322.1 hypothetical protein [Vibrio ostreicida]
MDTSLGVERDLKGRLIISTLDSELNQASKHHKHRVIALIEVRAA